MKKHLLIIASAALAVGATAQNQAVDPQILPGLHLSAMSPNGEYAAGQNEYENSVQIHNVTSMKTQTYEGQGEADYYTIGSGANPVSNAGITLISTTYDGVACYVENGRIKYLPVPEGFTNSFANAITPDGARIAGMVGTEMSIDAADVMEKPVIWNRSENGTYMTPVELPYPKADLTGRLPQYILIDGISADGKTLAGQVVDYSGMILMPIVYTENEEGEWSYKMLGQELVNPEGIEFPEDPGAEPNPIAYMGEESLVAYQAALEKAQTLVEPNPADYMDADQYEAYLAELAAGNYVVPGQFMTEEQQAEYYADLDQYYADLYPNPENYLTDDELAAYSDAYMAWGEKSEAFNEALMSIIMNGKSFDMNIFSLSQNGRYYAASVAYEREVEKEYLDPETGETYTDVEYVSVQSTALFDLVEGTSELIENDADFFTPNYVTDEGYVIGGKLATFFSPGTAPYIALSKDNVQPLLSYIETNLPELYEWMHEHMYQKVYEWDWDLEEDVEVEKWVLGYTTCNADMSALCMWVDAWDPEDDYPFYSYIIPFSNPAKVDTIAVDKAQLTASMDSKGVITINGRANNLDIYDLNGRRVMHVTNPGNKVVTNLGHGAYIVKVSNNATSAVVKGLR